MSRWMMLDRLRQDLRFAFRTLGRNPGFTAVAILTLALGIGANTAIFSLLNAVELRRLPVRDPQQLVMLEWSANQKVHWPGGGYTSYGGCDAGEMADAGHMASASAGCSFSYPVFDYFRSHSKLFSGLAAVAGPSGFQTRIHGEIVRADAQFVSGEFFSVLGVSAQVGRTLSAGDDQPGAEPAAVLSSRCWEAHFGSDPGIVGKTITLDGAPFTVVGVVAKEFFGLQPVQLPDLWIPVHAGARLGFGWWQSLGAGDAWLYVIGRVNPGVPVNQARVEASVLFRQAPGSELVFTPQIQTGMELAGIARGLSRLRNAHADQLRVLMAVVGLVLLLACANVANLLLTQASGRRREMAVRMAIGCSRARLWQQLLTESFLLSMLGAAAGLLVGVWAARALGGSLAARSGALIDVRLDPLVLCFTLGVACVAATLFGLAPAVAGTRERPAAVLKSGGASTRRGGFGTFLVGAEMALALVLLIVAGLFVRTLVNLETFDPGFRRDRLLTFRVMRPHDVNDSRTPRPVHAELRDRLAALPGVLSVTWASELLLVGNLEATTVQLAGREDLGELQVDSLRIGPRFFETMGMPVLAGRSVQIQDCQPDAGAIWINRRLAETYGSGVDPLGRVILKGKVKYQIAGIVGDTKYETLRSSIAPSVYFPARAGAVFVLRTAADPDSLAGAARATVRAVDSNLIVDELKSEAAQIDEQLFNERLMARLSAVFGLLALTMAAIGIYGVLAFSVTRRTAEIAIRMSLGAMPQEIIRLVLRDGLTPVLTGAAAGLLASWALTKLIAALLFGVTAFDAFTYVVATLFLLAVAMLACYVPARRATRVNPVAALRYE